MKLLQLTRKSRLFCGPTVGHVACTSGANRPIRHASLEMLEDAGLGRWHATRSAPCLISLATGSGWRVRRDR